MDAGNGYGPVVIEFPEECRPRAERRILWKLGVYGDSRAYPEMCIRDRQHLGFANDSLLALVMPELEVIVGGHSHTVIREPKKVNGVLIGQAGSNLEYAGVTTLRFKGKKLVDKSYQLVSLKDIGTPDQEIALLVEEISNRPEFKKIMGQAAEDLTRKEDVASLMTDAMRDAVGGDFAFYNKGGVRLNELRKGEITMEKIYKMEPFSNYIVVHEWNPVSYTHLEHF